ncbi:MAG: VUT family protein, partial [Nitrososphaera sp.]
MFIASLLVSNIIAGKIVTLFGITFPSAVIIFPIVYIVGDILPECFGLKRSQFVIMAGFLANLYAVIFFTISLKMPFPSFWQNQTAYETVLGYT